MFDLTHNGEFSVVYDPSVKKLLRRKAPKRIPQIGVCEACKRDDVEVGYCSSKLCPHRIMRFEARIRTDHCKACCQADSLGPNPVEKARWHTNLVSAVSDPSSQEPVPDEDIAKIETRHGCGGALIDFLNSDFEIRKTCLNCQEPVSA